jgi:hypothetical protein
MSKASELCEAIAEWLNERQYDLSFVAERANVWNIALDKSAELHAVVIPQEVETSLASRATIERRYTVSLIIQQRMTGAIDISQQDALMDLVEQIEQDIITEPMGDFRFIDHGGATRTVMETEALSSSRQFIAVLTLRYLGQ